MKVEQEAPTEIGHGLCDISSSLRKQQPQNHEENCLDDKGHFCLGKNGESFSSISHLRNGVPSIQRWEIHVWRFLHQPMKYGEKTTKTLQFTP